MADDLQKMIRFSETLDQLKNVFRRNLIMDESRRENTAEHSWHIAVMAMLFTDYAPDGTDCLHALKMLLVHDVVEIDAGDTFCFDDKGNADKAEREKRAADRIFGLLPDGLNQEMRGLWEEFEAAETRESVYANAMDRFQVLLQNVNTRGGTWRLYHIPYDRALTRYTIIRDRVPKLWPVVEAILEKARYDGMFEDSGPSTAG